MCAAWMFLPMVSDVTYTANVYAEKRTAGLVLAVLDIAPGHLSPRGHLSFRLGQPVHLYHLRVPLAGDGRVALEGFSLRSLRRHDG
jgi:hypothetical protein